MASSCPLFLSSWGSAVRITSVSLCVCMQNAEVTRQMTVARAAQDEVEAVRKEMQEKVKAAQEAADRQVRTRLVWSSLPNVYGKLAPCFQLGGFAPNGVQSLVKLDFSAAKWPNRLLFLRCLKFNLDFSCSGARAARASSGAPERAGLKPGRAGLPEDQHGLFAAGLSLLSSLRS